MEKKNYTVAIDLGSSNVAVAVGHPDAAGKLVIDDVAVREVEGVVRGEIKNIEQVFKSIREAVDEVESRLGIRITEAYTGISGQHIQCARDSYYVYVGGHDGEISKEDLQNLRDNMRNMQAPEGVRILEFIPVRYVIDDKEEVTDPVGTFGRKLEATFNFIMAESSAISRLEKALMKAEVRQSQLFINPMVAAEAVVLPDEKELGVAVLDIGAGTTDICIYHDRIARHIAVVPVGSDLINKDIRAYGILERHIEKLKTEYGSACPANVSPDRSIKVPGRTPREPKEISFHNLATIVEARLQDILDYAMAEIRRSGYEGKLGAGLVLTGGCAQTQDIEVMAKEYTGLDVRVACPDIHVAEESLDAALDTRLATVIGLLLKGIGSGKHSRVEVERKIVTPVATPPQPGPQRPARPIAPPVQQPEPPARDSFLGEEEDGDEAKPPRQKRGNPLKKLFDNLTKSFDVIDDNEI